MFRFGLSSNGGKFEASLFEGYAIDGDEIELLSGSMRLAVFIDVETTGLSHNTDEVIEVAARKVCFDRESGRIVDIGPSFQAFQEPKGELPKEITKLTGIKKEDLEGHSINWRAFDDFIQDAAIIVAHNAAFDRPFIDFKSEVSKSKIWGCSSFHIDWKEWFTSSKLDYLAICHGFFYNSHRALNDVDALIHLVSFALPKDDTKTYFYDLLQNAKQASYCIYVRNSPIETKDILKKRWYHWNGSVWYKVVSESQLEEEQSFLAKNVYASAESQALINKIPLVDNFKKIK